MINFNDVLKAIKQRVLLVFIFLFISVHCLPDQLPSTWLPTNFITSNVSMTQNELLRCSQYNRVVQNCYSLLHWILCKKANRNYWQYYNILLCYPYLCIIIYVNTFNIMFNHLTQIWFVLQFIMSIWYRAFV